VKIDARSQNGPRTSPMRSGRGGCSGQSSCRTCRGNLRVTARSRHPSLTWQNAERQSGCPHFQRNPFDFFPIVDPRANEATDWPWISLRK
jgi:hypothetical protein